MIIVSRDKSKQTSDCELHQWFLKAEMTAQKQRCPSFASIVSVLSIILYCAGFLKVELELNEQKQRIKALESVAETEPLTNEPNLPKTTRNVPGKFVHSIVTKNRNWTKPPNVEFERHCKINSATTAKYY